MNRLDPMKLFGLTDALLAPIHALIEQILPEFLQQDLRNAAVCDKVVTAVDAALVAQQPAAALVPGDVRRRIIRGLLDTVLDHVVLGPEKHGIEGASMAAS
jgi:hypothetical protein